MEVKCSKKDKCEIIKRSTWAGKDADMIFVNVPEHKSDKYTQERPYESYVVLDSAFDGGGIQFGVSFDMTVCEYDNFRSIVLECGRKRLDIEFSENAQIYFAKKSTNLTYEIDRWYHIEILFGKEAVLLIDGKPIAKEKFTTDKISGIALKMVAYPTYGPILESSLGICNLKYDFGEFETEDIVIEYENYRSNIASDDIEAAIAAVTWDKIAVMDNGSTEIKHSLNFFESGYKDIDIHFYSDNHNAVTSSGRVIRPKSSEGNAKVHITAIISDRNKSVAKTFDAIVLAKEKFEDPKYMSDEEFFGVYEKGKWLTESKLDYEKLPEVGKCVEKGDYEGAKEKLWQHFSGKDYGEDRNAVYSEYDKMYAEEILNQFQQLQQGYCMGVFDSNEANAKINASLIKPNASLTISLRALYNESTEFILRKKPVLRVITDKCVHEYPTEDMAMIRAGDGRDKCFDGEECAVRMYGEFLGNGTSYVFLKFRVFGIEDGENIEDARITLHGSVKPEYAGRKRLVAVKEFSSDWDSKTIKFSDNYFNTYSYQGLTDKNVWSRPPYADGEYQWQISRFPFYNTILNEYDKTGNDELLYGLQKNIENAIMSFGGFRSKNSRYTYYEGGIRGGYTRTLDASGKFSVWISVLPYLMKSKYCTSEFATAFLKSIWDTMNYLLTNCDRGMGNWTEFIFKGILFSADKIGEFRREFNGEDWTDSCLDTYEKTVVGCFFEDGSYREGNSGYCQTALDNYIRVKNKFADLGIDVSENYNNTVHKNAYYCANLFTADGSSIKYGDCINYRREEYNDWNVICNMFDDDELRYIVTYGTEGKKPKSTMYHSPDSRLTVMRSDFGREAAYLFTDVRGGGGHSHCDENSIILSAYGRTLLSDSGVFSYTADDPFRIWGLSTRAHNTVEIDGKNQMKFTMANEVPQGTVHKVYDDEKISVVSQSSFAYAEVEHKRTITFVKPDVFIVEDELIVGDGKEHEYDILWHFMPGVNPTINNGICETSFENDVNIKIIMPKNSSGKISDGYIDLSYGQVEKNKYLCCRINEKSDAKAVTVLIPERKGVSRNVTAEFEDGRIIIKENENVIFNGRSGKW